MRSKTKAWLCMATVATLTSWSFGCGIFGGGTPSQPMVAAEGNQSGEGTVRARAARNGDTDVEIRVEHLAPASRIELGASYYVVWIHPRDGGIRNAGVLAVDDDREGSWNTTTPFSAFTLTITPEASARVSAPTHAPVFSTAARSWLGALCPARMRTSGASCFAVASGAIDASYRARGIPCNS